MSKRDKTSLTILASIIVLIITFIITVVYSTYIPWFVLGVVALLVQFIYTMPFIASMYYKVNGVKIGFSRFIPLVSDIQIFSPVLAKTAIAATGLSVVALGICFIPPSVINTAFGAEMSFKWNVNAIVIFIMIAAITNFIYGFGECGVLRNVNFMVLDNSGEEVWKLEAAFYFLLMLPMLRIPALLIIRSKLKSLVDSGYGVNQEAIDVEEIGEEK